MESNNEKEYEINGNRGKELMQKGEFSEAIKVFTDAIRSDHSKMLPYVNRSLCYLALKRYDLSIVDITHALELADNVITKAQCLEIRSRSHIAKNDIINSFLDLNKSCDLYPTNAFSSRAHLFFNQNSFYEALCDFTQLEIIDPKNGKHKFKMGICYIKMGEREKAIEYLNKAKELGDEDAIVFLNKMSDRI